MNHALLINHRIAIRRQGPAQSDVRIKLAILVEVHDSQSLRPANLARRRLDLSTKQPQQSRLAAAVWSDQPHAHARRNAEMNILKQSTAAHPVRNSFERDQLLRLPVRGGKIDFRARRTVARFHFREVAYHLLCFADACFGLRRACLRPAPQPFQFRVHTVFEGFLPLLLCVQKRFLGLQKRAVVSLHAQRAIFVNAIELHHLVGHVLQKIAVVTHHYADERLILQ